MNINVSSIDPWSLLAALHNNTHPQGIGYIHALDRDITAAEAKIEATSTVAREQDPPFYPDYLFGRPIKAFLLKEGSQTYLSRTDLYDRDCPTGKGSAENIILKMKQLPAYSL
jgi:hypothetical protein